MYVILVNVLIRKQKQAKSNFENFSFTLNNKFLVLKLIYQKLNLDGTLYEVKHLKKLMKRQIFRYIIL